MFSQRSVATCLRYVEICWSFCSTFCAEFSSERILKIN